MLTVFFVFIFGAIVGSFLNVVIFRLGTGKSVVKGSSKCLSCGCNLRWYELIPIISFFARRGKCAHCGCRISGQYPAVEAVTGLVFLLVFNFFAGGGLAFGRQFAFYGFLPVAYYWAIFSVLVLVSVYDIRHQVIPNRITTLFASLSFFSFVFRVNRPDLFSDPTLSGGILSGLGLFAFFAALWFFSKGKAMGMGDAKLAAGIGLLLGFPDSITTVFFAFWLGAITGILLLFFSKLSEARGAGLRGFPEKKYNMKSKIPFGPFLALGALIAFLVGSRVIGLYI